jgi:hypothetical protein
MPAWPGKIIDTARGLSRLLNDELARGQGAPKAWLGATYPRPETVRMTVPVHILEYLSHVLVSDTASVEEPTTSPDAGPSMTADDEHTPFSWQPPDIGPLLSWTKARTYNLVQAAIRYQNPGSLIEEGLQMLRRHRLNYTDEGPNPTHLQLLWWEFPMESWDELREGCSMNFLVPPTEQITPNS